MQFITMITMMIVFIISAVDIAVATTISVAYSTAYDNSALSLTGVACSNGVNGLLTKGYDTLGSLPTFPDVGGSSMVAGWNSTKCGSCIKLTWPPVGTPIYVTIVDTASDGINLSESAMDTLTDGGAIKLGRVSGVNAIEVDPTTCGIGVSAAKVDAITCPT